MSNKIHESINELVPYISENSITYPLWEEGKYIPFVNFWQITSDSDSMRKLFDRVLDFRENIAWGYKLSSTYKRYKSNIHEFSIHPDYKETEDGCYEFVNPDWSIEEMISLVKEFLNSKNEQE